VKGIVGIVLAIAGVGGALSLTGVLHLLSPNVNVAPLLRVICIAAFGGVALVVVFALPIAAVVQLKHRKS
jgi:hypothetical protein